MFASIRHRRQDGWTSTPGAHRGASAYQTPTAGLSRSGYLGFVLEFAYGVAYGFALGLSYHECDKRQPRMSTNGSTRQLARTPGCSLWLSMGVRTGGRLHPLQAGERLQKQRPHAAVREQGDLRSWSWVWLAPGEADLRRIARYSPSVLRVPGRHSVPPCRH